MVLLSRNVRGDIDWLHDIPILAHIFLHRDNEEADIMFLSEESEQEITSESNSSSVNKHQR